MPASVPEWRLRQRSGEGAPVATNYGYFLIADITGYTHYLSASELDHAQKTLTALLNLLIRHTRPPLVISRLAGDAVISYGLREGFVAGQTFVEMLEDTYVGFRRQIELMVRNTTCTCNACRNIGALDLKFFVHFGEFGVQKLDGHDELVGSDVNLIHRLLKNRVTEATGLRAYTLYTDAAIRQLGLAEETGQLLAHAESYEHLGTVATWVQDMHPVWEEKRDAVQAKIAPADVLYRFELETVARPEEIWDFIVLPEHFNVLLGGDYTRLSKRRGGRVAVGTVYQCYHGEDSVTNVVLGWRPFTQIVVQVVLPLPIPDVTVLVAVDLTPTATGTHVVESFSRTSGSLRGRLLGDAGMKGRKDYFHERLQAFAAHVEAEVKARPRPPAAAAPADAEVDAAVRESLVAG
jgi:hypothetical protein